MTLADVSPFALVAFSVASMTVAFECAQPDVPVLAEPTTWVLEWHGCATAGAEPSCLPSFHKNPEGHYRFLECATRPRPSCLLVDREFWSEEDDRGYSGPHAWTRKEAEPVDFGKVRTEPGVTWTRKQP